MTARDIVIEGAREHNLRNVTVTIPRESLTVLTGPSGCGKSSLAFDTLYAEGHRRYVESLSAYARQFLGILKKPDVDAISGLSPAIAIEQKTSGHNPRSTVGTSTEVYDFLRLLFARIGRPHCHQCHRPITRQTVQEMTDRIGALPSGRRYQILAPLVTGRKGEFSALLERLRKDGFVRVCVDTVVTTLDDLPALARNRSHTIEVVVDRLTAGKAGAGRITESLETALSLSENGTVHIDTFDGTRTVYSNRLACVTCGIALEELSPRAFSFNTPLGACTACKGLGTQLTFNPDLLVPEPARTLRDGAIVPWNGAATEGSWNSQIQKSVCSHYRIPLDKPWSSLSARHQSILLNGSGDEEIPMEWTSRKGSAQGTLRRTFEGVIPNLLRRYHQSASEEIRRWIEGFMTNQPCRACAGKRLRPEVVAVTINNHSIADVAALPLAAAQTFLTELALNNQERQIASRVIDELLRRLSFLVDVGVGYLSLDRVASTLSGGESQRIRLATQIGSQLGGVIYILDEPSIGLHPRDNSRLLATLKALRDIGNTVVVIEHDRETISAADMVIDIGPGAGIHGGRIVAAGPPAAIAAHPDSLTGAYLRNEATIPIPRTRRTGNGNTLLLSGARGHNLQSVDCAIPLATLTCVTGVSGSGKSTLVNHTLHPALVANLGMAAPEALPYDTLAGFASIDKIIAIDQSPIGRTPRSNPATYTRIFDPVRSLFAAVPESRVRGYGPGRFSFNVKGGRCEGCEGDGVKRIEMHFLPDVYVACEHCRGRRYNRETLDITYKGKTIADVLDMTVDEAIPFFDAHPQIKSRLTVLSRVGLGYIHLGQPATTLSGGEAQRVKLSAELGRRPGGQTFYILDEPTTGLHFEDIRLLMNVLHELVEKGNTVLVIEHHPDVIKCADHIIDMGPEGGNGGGRIIATGTPEQIAASPASLTGAFLGGYLGVGRPAARKRHNKRPSVSPAP